MVETKDILKSAIIQGFGTLIVREFFLKLFSFVGQLFLARILFPQDFGVFVILIFVINFFTLFSDIGLSLAIIQKKQEPTHEALSTIFIFKIVLAIFLIIILWCIAPLIRVFFQTFDSTNILMIRVLSLTLLLTSIRSIPIALLERKIKYHVISVIDIIGVVTYYISALLSAYSHLGVWSFIIASLAKEIIETIIIYFVQPFFPSATIRMADIRKMVKFGIFVQGNGLVNFFNASMTPIIGGRLSGTHAVGLLDFANSLASLPEIIAINFGRVAFAGYSRIQHQRNLLFSSVNKSISMLSILLYVFPVILFAFADELIRYIYTEKWIGATPALYWFGATAFFQPIIASIGQGTLAIGNSKGIFGVTVITTIFGWILALVLTYKLGFIGIAIASFVISFLLCLLYIFVFSKSGYTFRPSVVIPKLMIVAGTLVICFIINNLFSPTFFFLILKILIALVVYFGLLFIFTKSDIKEFISVIRIWLSSSKK